MTSGRGLVFQEGKITVGIGYDLLTLIRIAGGIYDSKNSEQLQLKVARIKHIFCPRSVPHKMFQKYILLILNFIKS